MATKKTKKPAKRKAHEKKAKAAKKKSASNKKPSSSRQSKTKSTSRISSASSRPASRTTRDAKKPAGRKKTYEDVYERRAKHFEEEVNLLGKKFEERMQERGERWDSWYNNTFDVVGPFISSLIGTIIVLFALWVINVINVPLASIFISNATLFISANIGLFFLIFLFFSYSSYLSKTSPNSYRTISPFLIAVGFSIFFWITGQSISIANLSVNSVFLTAVSGFFLASVAAVFVFVLIIGYVALFIKTVLESPNVSGKIGMTEKRQARRLPSTRHTQRLYRSGRDRILGGVCGGIAEYLGIDPVIIRLLWIVGSLAWGSGIILYIIAWIIIPRNPKDKWD